MYKVPLVVSVYFGSPGAGKSSVAAMIARRDMRHGLRVFSNFPILGTLKLDPLNDLGTYDVSNSRIIIDEAGIDFNNRSYKSFPENCHKFFKLHRHYKCAVDIFSQSFDDMDKKLRLLAQRYYLITRTPIPGLVCIRRIRKSVSIDENTRQIIDAYDFVSFFQGGFRFCWVRPAWRLFNSWHADPLPEIDEIFYNKGD